MLGPHDGLFLPSKITRDHRSDGKRITLRFQHLANGGRDDDIADIHWLGIALARLHARSEEHTPELQSLMRISYAVFCLKKKNINSIYSYAHIVYHITYY